MASVKNAKPSSAKGRPTTSPKVRMKVGQSRPSSKESTVPETAPTAKRMLVPLAMRRDSSRHAGSPEVEDVGHDHEQGQRHPRGREGHVERERDAHLGARIREVIHRRHRPSR
jgi:hypothetical protein